MIFKFSDAKLPLICPPTRNYTLKYDKNPPKGEDSVTPGLFFSGNFHLLSLYYLIVRFLMDLKE